MSLLRVDNLNVFDPQKNRLVKGISFSIEAGQCLAIIGESGSGKSLTALSVTDLTPKGITTRAASIFFNSIELTEQNADQMRRLRGKDIAYVFQDYHASFTPYRLLGVQIDEVMRSHLNWDARARRAKALSILQDVGLDADKVYSSYSFQLSGGQLQRTALALAMLLEPKLLIADEPTTALDAVSAQNVLQLMDKLKREKNCAILFISHDLRCVRRFADHIAIMRKGVLLEQSDKMTILNSPKHDYTRNLLASIPPLRNPPVRLPVFEGRQPEAI